MSVLKTSAGKSPPLSSKAQYMTTQKQQMAEIQMMSSNNSKARLRRPSLIVTVLALALSGCSTYGSSFSCGDAKGAECRSMDRIDRLISSGEIETFTNPTIKATACRSGRCQHDRLALQPNLPQAVEGIELVESRPVESTTLPTIENGVADVN